MVFQLTKRLAFPDPHWGDPDGLLAIGGDLSVDRLILAYSNGIFPWYAFREKVIQWWCPLQRFVIFPEEIHISHSMRTLMNKDKYKVTFNHAFERVIRNCSKLRIEQEGAWLGHPHVRTEPGRQRRSMGRRQAGRRPVWSDFGHMLLRRKHVLTRTQRFQACPDTTGPTAPCARRYPYRLPV